MASKTDSMARTALRATTASSVARRASHSYLHERRVLSRPRAAVPRRRAAPRAAPSEPESETFGCSGEDSACEDDPVFTEFVRTHMPSGVVKAITSKHQLALAVAESVERDRLVTIVVLQPGFPPSFAFAPKLDRCAVDFDHEASFFVMDASLNQETFDAAKSVLNVHQLPTVVFFSKGKESRRFLGGGDKKLRWALASELNLSATSDSRLVYALGRPPASSFVPAPPFGQLRGIVPESLPRGMRSSRK